MLLDAFRIGSCGQHMPQFRINFWHMRNHPNIFVQSSKFLCTCMCLYYAFVVLAEQKIDGAFDLRMTLRGSSSTMKARHIYEQLRWLSVAYSFSPILLPVCCVCVRVRVLAICACRSTAPPAQSRTRRWNRWWSSWSTRVWFRRPNGHDSERSGSRIIFLLSFDLASGNLCSTYLRCSTYLHASRAKLSLQEDGCYPKTNNKTNKDQHFFSPNPIVTLRTQLFQFTAA